MVKRTLVLRREALDELTTGELAEVAAGARTSDCPDYTYYCITGPAICRETRITCI
jgi:hypothetical protein